MTVLFFFIMLIFLICFLLSWLFPNPFISLLGGRFSKGGTRAILGFLTLIMFIISAATSQTTPQVGKSNTEQKQEAVPTEQSQKTDEEKQVQQAEAQKQAEEEAAKKAEEEEKQINQPKPNEESQPKSYSTTIEDFPKKLEKYLNGTWDEMPGTRYKVYWWDEWEGVDSGNTHLVVEPSFEPTKQQCQRIAQVATISRVYWVGEKEGVIHVTEYDNSGDYCTLRTP
ncbi:MAG: hypothetical protein Q8K92_12185 [Leadbetterella sp.]|nr:hypothetical protein [Leadbetterella sp.]